MALDNTDVNVGERRSTLSPGGKGLQKGQVGLLAIVVMGVATVAPAYAITSSLGPTASSVGLQVPIVLLLGFIPMFMVSLAYKELNADLPDSGTTFTWASRAFGPWVGWMGGWGFLAANIIVLSNLAGVAVDFLYLFLADITGNAIFSRFASRQSLAWPAINRDVPQALYRHALVHEYARTLLLRLAEDPHRMKTGETT